MPKVDLTQTVPLAFAPLLLLLGFSIGLLLAAVLVRSQTRGIGMLADRLAAGTAIEPDEVALSEGRLSASLRRLATQLNGVQALATTDPLTGVLNRQAIFRVLDDEIRRAGRYGHTLSVVFVDVDNFKRVNDTYGHVAGDVTLRAVAGQLRSNLRSSDRVGRYGGEEFMLVLPETDVPAAAAIAEKLRRLVGANEVQLEDDNSVRVTLSAGVAGGPGQHLHLDKLVRDADAALYAAKGLGRDQVYIFREVDDDGLVARAPISPEARMYAIEVGRRAFGAAHAELAGSLDDRPSWAGRPSQLTGEVAVTLARALGLPDGEVERIRTAGLLHDLGKLAIPDTILSKPAELSDVEWRAMTEHPKIGQVILEQAGSLRDAARLVLHHHEWFNGHGYPHGLSGDDIPIGSRIVAIADAYDAMVRGRPFREPLTHVEALRELQKHAGEQFDPELVAVFAGLYREQAPAGSDGRAPTSRARASHRHPTATAG